MSYVPHLCHECCHESQHDIQIPASSAALRYEIGGIASSLPLPLLSTLSSASHFKSDPCELQKILGKILVKILARIIFVFATPFYALIRVRSL